MLRIVVRRIEKEIEMNHTFRMMAAFGIAAVSMTLLAQAQSSEKKSFTGKQYTSKPVTQQSQPPAAMAPRNVSPLDDFEFGTRITHFILNDSKRDPAAVRASDGSFYGSITELDAKQSYMPVKLFVDYKMTPYWGFDLTWDQFRADTITRSDGHNDGTIELKGPIVSIFGRLPNESIVTPYAGFGFGYFLGNFDEEYRWQYAIQDDGTYKNGAGWSQTMDLDNSFGWVVYAGAAIEIVDHWNADLFVRYTKVDVDGTHTTPGDVADVSFPMSNTTVGLGVRYVFRQ